MIRFIVLPCALFFIFQLWESTLTDSHFLPVTSFWPFHELNDHLSLFPFLSVSWLSVFVCCEDEFFSVSPRKVVRHGGELRVGRALFTQPNFPETVPKCSALLHYSQNKTALLLSWYHKVYDTVTSPLETCLKKHLMLLVGTRLDSVMSSP